MKTLLSFLLGWLVTGMFLLWALVDSSRARRSVIELGRRLELQDWEKMIRQINGVDYE